MIKIALGSDHAGFELKKLIMMYLKSENIDFDDLGPYDDSPVDYPLYAERVSKSIMNEVTTMGILICGTGVGMSIAANKIAGIRAALCADTFTARLTRQHNDSNILVLGARVVDTDTALDITKTFINTEFPTEERNVRRINLIKELENS